MELKSSADEQWKNFLKELEQPKTFIHSIIEIDEISSEEIELLEPILYSDEINKYPS